MEKEKVYILFFGKQVELDYQLNKEELVKLLQEKYSEFETPAVNAQLSFVEHKIEILEDSMDGIWISGLPRNIRIITIGQEYVFQGQIVNVKEISESPEA